ncbi:hypothetical protein AUJ66_05210 [Candidatus Desantisbacteria bacterium CG1_02_38_46]|uniref:Uncharacterized protein n=2 Tax=unclassified Candidatus Desantisiibacteriota TaxID=3106372 RepID=A0A1J4SBP2_9BACT|nr:MAG: hypothetical protein AUJ66_05210 [Candidatus Desantisbacteria bacterium CG1_02_38_46]PIU51276.1 MAG: hypothetical protein COS91_05330 [Candidatus Desantisbacteria bacterium CG07_land_8_20_14_0_80_39_15]
MKRKKTNDALPIESSEESSDLPDLYRMKLCSMHVQKGSDGSGTKQIISWEVAKPCRGERCPASDLCDYERGSRCRVENTYLRSVAAVIYRNFITVLDEPTLMRIGLHLMPIYQNLCRLKIVEIGVVDAVMTDDKGKPFINPVYKEMREHIKLLEQTWRSLGLSDYFIEAELPDIKFDDDVRPPERAMKLRNRVVRKVVAVGE